MTKEAVKKYNRAYYEKNKDKMNASMRRHYLKYKEKYQDYKLFHRHGISLEQKKAMIVKQNGKCAICEKEPKSKKGLFNDHDHKTNVERELLCSGCNSKLGVLEDKEWLKKARKYLRKHRGEDRL